MNFRRPFLAIISASTLLLTNCGGPGAPTSVFANPKNITITISPQITSLPSNGTQSFTATVTNGSATNVSWDIAIGENVGAFSNGHVFGTGPTVTYTAPATPPIYTETSGDGTFYTAPGGQGAITISASAFPAATSATFAILGPTSVGIQSEYPSVQLGKLVYLFGYCVGLANNGINWMVNGVAGGSPATGTMTANTQFIYYNAPMAMPMSGNTVIITAVCQADTTKTASTTLTLTQ
jgi:hypothetical protein